MTQIGTVYAQALYSLAAEEGCTEEVLRALSALETSVEQEPEFLRLLSTPNLSKEERCKIIDDSFSGKMPEILLNFLKLLTEKGYAEGMLKFTDNAAIQSWSAEYVSTLSTMGILTGFDDGSFRPNGAMTRAQVATVL